MIDPDRERKRAEAAQRHAADQAQAGMAAPGADMVAVFSVAGFELADIFAEWSRRRLAWAREEGESLPMGPPEQLPDETPDEFGQRVARAILQLIKEV